jgi:hypothetical protein
MDTMDSKIETTVINFKDCFRKFLRIKDEGEVVSSKEIDRYRALYIYAKDFVESYEEWQKEINIGDMKK